MQVLQCLSGLLFRRLTGYRRVNCYLSDIKGHPEVMMHAADCAIAGQCQNLSDASPIGGVSRELDLPPSLQNLQCSHSEARVSIAAIVSSHCPSGLQDQEMWF
jgi:hypothetical protein